MLGKLSIRNAKRQAKDYVIYFITVIISVALMFSFNSIAVSKDIIELSTYMEHFSKAITGVSIIIIFVMAWLINYTMKFMLEKRSKEFGTYQILGIEKKDISKMFTLENLVIGVVAFVVGIFAGTFLYQVFSSIIMNLFNQPYEIQLTFNIKAVGITAAYFFGIFVLVLLNCRRKIKKTKVYDLLYADKKNENNIIKILKGSAISIIITLIGLLIYSIILSYTSVTETTMPVTIIIISAISILIGSTLSTSNIKKNGILNGILVGGIYIAILYILSSLITGNFLLNVNSIIMIIASVLTGALGGIIGVNKK